MPSVRRVKVFGIVVLMVVVTILFWTASLRQKRAQGPRTGGDFYAKTLQALDKKPNFPGAAATDNDAEVARAMAARLKKAEEVAKNNANAKGGAKPDPPSVVVGVGSSAEGHENERSVAGRKKFSPGDSQEPLKEETYEETQEEHDVETELNSILKKSPSEPSLHLENLVWVSDILIKFLTVIIFSKSYCPHSRRAKGILLDKYIIDPAPFVVELDQHPLGPKLQARLAELTGRRTVPNVLINGVSIGGGDEIAEFDTKKALVDKVKDLGGKKMLDVKPRSAPEEDHGLR